jgi:hypothetical protein
MKHLSKVWAIIALIVVSCNSNNTSSENMDMNSLLNENQEGMMDMDSEESLNSMIQSLPSPLEISSLIKGSGVAFNEKFLNSTENKKYYTNDLKKALAMGIYSGNLGYINVYEKSYLAIKYLSTIKDLADDLSIGQFFDFETIRRLAANSNKLDSLIYLSSMNFDKMDRYLRTQKRSHLSVLIVTGTWLESLYLATQVAKTSQHEGLLLITAIPR